MSELDGRISVSIIRGITYLNATYPLMSKTYQSSVNPKSTSNQSSKPCTVLQYPSTHVNKRYHLFECDILLMSKTYESDRSHTYTMYIYMCVCHI